MATGPKIVHKQFNSPIGLYSQQNIQETLNKHMSNLDNGSVGINFNNPATDKPANLANSAVLRMLEEEERNRKGLPKLDPTQVQAILDTLVRPNRRFDKYWPPEQPPQYHEWKGSTIVRVSKGQKKVVWPPVPETNGYHSPQQQSPAFYNNAQHSPQPQSQPQYQPPPQEPAYPPQSQPQYQQPQYQQPQYQQPQYQQPQYQQPQYQQPQYYQQPQAGPQSQPAFCEGKKQEVTGLSKLIPVGPGVTAAPTGPSSPYGQGPASPQPYRPQQQSRWAPVPAPLSPQPQNTQPGYPQQYSPQPQYSPQYSEPAYQPPQKQFEPPPATITLRQQQPVHQKPPPVFPSQPAAASFKGGVNMRGDQKWPPQSVKEAVAAENEARLQLARGPACRPRKVKKDYRSFFAQHALNNNYPGYRAPPGTQHYEDQSGRSSY